ncbi:hypothetical protein D3C72_1657960 [compost metagenome]
MQGIDQHARHVRIVAHLQHGLVPAVELAGDVAIFLGYTAQLGHAQLERLVLVTHHFHLPLLQRDGASRQRAAQLDLTEQRGMLFEEIRVLAQVLGDGAGIECGGH